MSISESIWRIISSLDAKYRNEILEAYYNCEQIKVQRGYHKNYCESYIMEKIKYYISSSPTMITDTINEEINKCVQSIKFRYSNTEIEIREFCKEKVMEKTAKRGQSSSFLEKP